MKAVKGLSLFCYGTLQYAPIMQKVTGRSFTARPAILHDFARFRVRGALYPAVIESPGCQVEGVLYQGLSVDHVSRLDRYEGPAYSRVLTRVVTEDGVSSEAMVYLFPEDRKHLLETRDWDSKAFECRHMQRYLLRL